MKITPLEIRSYPLRKSLFGGLRAREVEGLKELAAGAIEDANRVIMRLEDRLRDTESRLAEHMANESLLKEAITTTQKMTGDIKAGAKKEAELIMAEARLRAEEIIRQAQSRATQIVDEIHRLRRQRAEFESSIRAIVDYHSTQLLIDEEESRKADNDSEKVKFLPK